MEAPDPRGCLFGRREAASLGVSLGEEAGAEGDPREPGRSGEPPYEEAWEVLPGAAPPALGDPPPAKESGSRTNSDVDGLDGMSNDVIVQYLHCKLKAVTKFQDPAVKEFLKARLRDTRTFLHLLEWQAQDSEEVARLKDANQRPQQELQEAKRSQGTGSRFFPFPWPKTDFHIQVRVAGKTGGCEKQFFKKVSDLLSDQHINLKREKYREDSGHFLLVFRPVATSVGCDMANAIEGLGSEPKAVLVMLHHKPKESTSAVDTRKQVHHPAVVRTVHARYTLQSGFYACLMNEEAVAAVAEVLQGHC